MPAINAGDNTALALSVTIDVLLDSSEVSA